MNKCHQTCESPTSDRLVSKRSVIEPDKGSMGMNRERDKNELETRLITVV